MGPYDSIKPRGWEVQIIFTQEGIANSLCHKQLKEVDRLSWHKAVLNVQKQHRIWSEESGDE